MCFPVSTVAPILTGSEQANRDVWSGEDEVRRGELDWDSARKESKVHWDTTTHAGDMYSKVAAVRVRTAMNRFRP